MRNKKRFLGPVFPILILIAAASPIVGHAQADQSNEVDADAIALLKRTTDYMSSLKQFRVDSNTSIEAVILTGQKLQFDHHVVITVMRPNKFRAERAGELISQTFLYDGKSLSVNLPEQEYYATTAAPPTLDAMLDFARDELGVIAPASDLIYADAFARLSDKLTSAFIYGEAMVGGVRCQHLAFRNPEVDWQIWIQEGDEPWPIKMVVTSKRMAQSPQFTVVLTKWDAAPEVTDATFNFVPPTGSHKIDFIPATALIKK